MINSQLGTLEFDPFALPCGVRGAPALYRFEVQHLNDSLGTFPMQAAKANVTGSSERISCAALMTTGSE